MSCTGGFKFLFKASLLNRRFTAKILYHANNPQSNFRENLSLPLRVRKDSPIHWSLVVLRQSKERNDKFKKVPKRGCEKWGLQKTPKKGQIWGHSRAACVGVTFLWGGYDPHLQVPLKDGKRPVWKFIVGILPFGLQGHFLQQATSFSSTHLAKQSLV